eukprot:6710584-Pyramimonas_sp.AAC.1
MAPRVLEVTSASVSRWLAEARSQRVKVRARGPRQVHASMTWASVPTPRESANLELPRLPDGTESLTSTDFGPRA